MTSAKREKSTNSESAKIDELTADIDDLTTDAEELQFDSTVAGDRADELHKTLERATEIVEELREDKDHKK
jgi:hypothetical protein